MDTSFYAAIWEAGEKDDWKDPATWAKGNPNLGVSKKLDYLERECAAAAASPAKQNTFRRLELNQWTSQETRWLDMDVWAKNAGPVSADLAGRPCYAGLDLSSTTDFTALVLVFAMDGGEYHLLPFFWVPEEQLASREKRGTLPRATLEGWASKGLVTLTDGNVVDYEAIRAKLRELATLHDIREVAFDRWGATGIVTQLQADGFEVSQFGQGMASMAGPTKEFGKLVEEGKIRHGDNPVLSWMAGNATVQQDAAGNMKPAKHKSSDRIDGIVAAIMGLGRAQAEASATPAIWVMA
jgi:phage terminase large subunit-like protein